MKYTVISMRDLQQLVDDGHVKRDGDGYCQFHGGMPEYLSLDSAMVHDIIGHIRRIFIYEKLDMSMNPNPFIDGISGDYDKWFVPCWCILEWLRYKGIEL